MAEDDTKTVEEVQKPSMIKKLIIPLALSLVVSAVAIGALNLLGVISIGTQKAEQAEVVEGEEDEDSVAAADAGSPAHFFTFYPDFLVNFSSRGSAHYLKLTVDVMSRDQAVVEAMEQYHPILRSHLLKQFKEVDFDSLQTPEGVDSMQAVAFDEIKRVLKKYHGDNNIEGVYFTSFVIQ